MTPKDDQQLGGIVMKLIQEFINSAALYTVFMQWFRKERAKEDDPIVDPVVTRRLNITES
jgi:putative membrane protein